MLDVRLFMYIYSLILTFEVWTNWSINGFAQNILKGSLLLDFFTRGIWERCFHNWIGNAAMFHKLAYVWDSSLIGYWLYLACNLKCILWIHSLHAYSFEARTTPSVNIILEQCGLSILQLNGVRSSPFQVQRRWSISWFKFCFIAFNVVDCVVPCDQTTWYHIHHYISKI